MKSSLMIAKILLLLLPLHYTALAVVDVVVNPDGSKYTAVMHHGAVAGKYNIVFVGDGFTSSTTDQAKFNTAVNDAIDAMMHKQPYGNNICAFNVWRVNVISAESGIDHPILGIQKNTALDCTFGDNISEPERLIYSTDESKVQEAANYAPKYNAIYVLVNDAEYGGASGSVVYTSLNTSMKEVIVHELGHFVGKLADEYTCRYCDGRPEPVYSGPEPWQTNVTIQTDRNLIKWKSFINSSTPIPTTVDNPPGVVGLWAGGLYSPTVVYHPQLNCLMRILNVNLCAVCNNQLSNILSHYCTFCERNPRICMIRDLHNKLILPNWTIILRLPLCCFCPLDIDFHRAELELDINPEDYSVNILGNAGQTNVPFETGRGKNGGLTITFKEHKDVDYFLEVIPRKQLRQTREINVSLSRDGRASTLF